MNQPHAISIKEWMELITAPEIRQAWGLDGSESAEYLADIVYGVRFDFVSGSPGYVGDLYILHGDTLGEPMRLIRRDGKLEVL